MRSDSSGGRLVAATGTRRPAIEVATGSGILGSRVVHDQQVSTLRQTRGQRVQALQQHVIWEIQAAQQFRHPDHIGLGIRPDREDVITVVIRGSAAILRRTEGLISSTSTTSASFLAAALMVGR